MTRLLLTGGSGMVGRNVREAALRTDITLIAPSSAELNLLDACATLAFIEAERPDIIVHAAGRVGGIHANIAAPVAFLTDNWDMGRNLLMAARTAGVPRLLNLGSSCMYPADSPDALTEEQILSGPLEPTNEGYALAKSSIARLCTFIGREDGRFTYKTLVPSNLYGPHDSFDPARSHLVPAIIHKLHLAKTRGDGNVEIWGTGEARREFLYAGDLADAILMAIDTFDALPDLLNIGTGADFTVNEHYRIAAEVIGYTGTFSHDLSKPAGMKRKLLDVSRARQWGFVASTSLRDGIASTYQHYLATGASDALSAR